jgi:ATP-dependent DNA ligase
MQTFKFPSRSSGAEHTVTVGANNKIVCTCRGFDTPGQCWHVREVADKLGIPSHARSKTPPLPWAAQPTTIVPERVTHEHMNGVSTTQRFIEPMLASALKETQSIEDFADADHVLEVKYDGHRMIVHVSPDRIVTAWARSGIARILSRHIINHAVFLAPGIYDGELFIPNGTSTDVTDLKLLHKHKLVLFDILSVYAPQDHGRTDAEGYRSTLDLALKYRRDLLELAMSKVPAPLDPEIFIAPQYAVTVEKLNELWDRGEEGAIIKDLRATYEPERRVKHWVKFKKELSAEVVVTSYKAGKLGPHSRIMAKDKHGVVVNVKTLNDMWRAAFARSPEFFIGQVLVISYQQKTDDGRYRHPRADHFRDVTPR